jgi:hypothetical protein
MGVSSGFLIGRHRSPDGAKRNPGPADRRARLPPDFASLHSEPRLPIMARTIKMEQYIRQMTVDSRPNYLRRDQGLIF